MVVVTNLFRATYTQSLHYFNRETILNAVKTLAVKKMAMFAARNLLLVKRLLLHTGKLWRAQQSSEILKIMLW